MTTYSEAVEPLMDDTTPTGELGEAPQGQRVHPCCIACHRPAPDDALPRGWTTCPGAAPSYVSGDERKPTWIERGAMARAYHGGRVTDWPATPWPARTLEALAETTQSNSTTAVLADGNKHVYPSTRKRLAPIAPAAVEADQRATADLNRDLSRVVRRAKHRAGLTTVELAALAGVSMPAVYGIERGNSQTLPNVRTLARLAAVLAAPLTINPDGTITEGGKQCMTAAT